MFCLLVVSSDLSRLKEVAVVVDVWGVEFDEVKGAQLPQLTSHNFYKTVLKDVVGKWRRNEVRMCRSLRFKQAKG